MTREERLKQCRFYKGEKRSDESPLVKEGKHAPWETFYWRVEAAFVRRADDDEEEENEKIKEYARLHKQRLVSQGFFNHRSIWEGKSSDELVMMLFSYTLKLVDMKEGESGSAYEHRRFQFFFNKFLPSYLGETSM